MPKATHRHKRAIETNEHRLRHPRTNEPQAIGFALGAVLLWSTVATAFKLGLRHLEPVQLLFLGSVVSLVFFSMCTIVRGHVREHFALPGPTLCLAAGLGLLNPFVYYLVLFEAYARLPAQIAQPLNYTWAVTLALLAVPLLRQPLTRRDLMGIGTSYAGVAVLLSQGSPPGEAGLDHAEAGLDHAEAGLDHAEAGLDPGEAGLDPVGVALALVSTLIWSVYWLVSVRLRLDPLVAMTVGFGAGTLAIGLVCASTAGFPPLTPANVGYGVWVGLVEMGITFLLWREALARTAYTARIGQLIFLSPFLSFLLIATFVGETIQSSSVLGLAGIVLGLMITRRAAP